MNQGKVNTGLIVNHNTILGEHSHARYIKGHDELGPDKSVDDCIYNHSPYFISYPLFPYLIYIYYAISIYTASTSVVQILLIYIPYLYIYIIKETHSSAFVTRLRLRMDLKFRDFCRVVENG